MDETKGAIFGSGWSFMAYMGIFYFALGYSSLWMWVGAFLVLVAGAAAGFFIGKQMNG